LDNAAALRAAMHVRDLDAVVLVGHANIRYVTALSLKPSERFAAAVVLGSGPVRIVLPAMEEQAARSLVPTAVECHAWLDEDGPKRALADSMRGREGPAIGFERRSLTVEQFELIESVAPGATLIGCDELISALRAVKSDDEVEHIRSAARIVDDVIENLTPSLGLGNTESEVASECRRLLEARGAEVSADPVVLAGSRSALPHGKSSAELIRAGDLVIVDMRAVIQGYWADITRTFVAGKNADERQKQLHDIVLSARFAALEAVRVGNPCSQVDLSARQVIEDAGFGQYFSHRTGHGLGLEPHEPPFLTSANTDLLEEGMVITIEPGIYIPGYGGVRVEDDFLVGPDAPEPLTSAPLGIGKSAESG
jgi:Xaa-Pro dipeptidase